MGRGSVTARCQPHLEHERRLRAAGYAIVAGVDEAGRGAWAGPLIAAAGVLPPVVDDGARLLAELAGVRDSKLLDHRRRVGQLATIRQLAAGIGVGRVEADELDRIGLGEANRVAWRRAIAALPHAPDFLLLDAFRLLDHPAPQQPLVRGDRACLSIAAASIVAKVTRDLELHALDECYPGYGFARHKGYGTAAHQAALRERGSCPAHRHSFAPLRGLAADPAR